MRTGKGKYRLLFMTLFIGAALLCGCAESREAESREHEPLTLLSGFLQYNRLEELVHEKYPEVCFDYVSYTGSNTTGFLQYQLNNGEILDLMPFTVFSHEEEQEKYLLDLSGYGFLNYYKTGEINQVTLDGSVYMVPMSSSIIGLYYNRTLFEERGWEVPENFAELKALAETIREAGMDPVAAQFFLSGNGFFDLFTLAKTGFLSTPRGFQWERDFKAGNATAAEGLSEAVALLQELIDCGFLDAEDVEPDDDETLWRFYNREAAMYLNAGTIPRFTQNTDGTGDKYGIMPFFGAGEDDSVLISTPLCYFGLSKELEEPGNEQKLEDALKVMEILATQEAQKSLSRKVDNYIAPLKNEHIPEDSPFHEVRDVIISGHTSNLAYAGYEPILIGVGDKVRDWVAGKCTGKDVLALADELQAASLTGSLPAIAVASQDFTREQTAQLQAEAFRLAAGTDIGMVSLGAYHDGYENYSGVCGRLFAGEVTRDIVYVVVPGIFQDPVCILTLTGAQIKELIRTGFVTAEGVEGFPYIPSGLSVIPDKDGSAGQIIMADGSDIHDTATYTVAMDRGGFTEETGQKGAVRETGLIVSEVVENYMREHSPLSPLEDWRK